LGLTRAKSQFRNQPPLSRNPFSSPGFVFSCCVFQNSSVSGSVSLKPTSKASQIAGTASAYESFRSRSNRLANHHRFYLVALFLLSLSSSYHHSCRPTTKRIIIIIIIISLHDHQCSTRCSCTEWFCRAKLSRRMPQNGVFVGFVRRARLTIESNVSFTSPVMNQLRRLIQKRDSQQCTKAIV
jgi:hypothetical protein